MLHFLDGQEFAVVVAVGVELGAVVGGFILWGGPGKDKPWEEGAFAAAVSEPGAKNHAWFRGGWRDPLTMAWKAVAGAACYDRAPVTEGGHSPGATLFVPFRIGAGESKTIALRLAWFVGQTNLRVGKDAPGTAPDPSQPQQFRPWYAGRFTDINSVSFFWRDHFAELRQKSARFSDCFYDTSLPGEVVEAVAANLAIGYRCCGINHALR